MSNLLNHHVVVLKKLNIQRIIWLSFSLIFVAFIFIIYLTWDLLTQIQNINLLRSSIVIVAATAAAWWYWTMTFITQLIVSRSFEILLLKEITQEISDLKAYISSKEQSSDR